ncbi:MAG: amidohydrolase family protein [Acidimicrobiia bacterium]
MNARIVFVLVGLVAVTVACTGSSDPTTTTVPATTTSTTAPPVRTTTTTTVAVPTVAPAGVVFTGGDVVTMDPEFGIVQAMAISGDRIVAVGSQAEIEPYIGDETIVIDLEGRAVGPGFVDPHTHILTDWSDFAEGQRVALRHGITSLGDASVEPDAYDQLVTAAQSDELRIRTSMYLGKTDPCGVPSDDWYLAHPAGSEPGNRLRVQGIKIFDDGGVCGQVAGSETFVDGYEVGAPYHSVETLVEWINTADAAGYQVVVHAQGDLAIRGAQDAYEQVLGGNDNPLRHRIDHNSIPTPDLLPRFTELNLVPVVFALGSSCSPDAPWTEFYRRNGDRPGDMVRANPDIRVAWHGDDPWVSPVSPILDMYSLVTRADFAEDGSICPAPDWFATGGVTIEQAYPMVTLNGAYALGRDDEVGSLTPGKHADLVVMTDNPLTVPIDELPSVAVVSTMIGGRTEYCADGAERWCAEA